MNSRVFWTWPPPISTALSTVNAVQKTNHFCWKYIGQLKQAETD